ncbi:hypothetical protein ILUMI_24788 [Ignelater luminosus]|uniref:Tetraspanin n=1 Tax=Ignelater luminosus TaxID=2038154 RepID=A0A8K0C5N9_IGNLU|nr:hypothetical protein ILUMI_24788 [Ignelater luminosus]
MKALSLTGSKALLAFCNFLLLACGCTLVTGGLLVLFDSGRILLSRLLSPGPLTAMPHPLLYYLALGVTALGLLLAGVGILGCWASCLHSYLMLTAYFLIIMVILVGECAIYAISWAWPHCLGLDLDAEELTKTLQRSYGVPGQEQFTAAIDLAQSTFNCCGIVTANEYDTSLWRLQALGPNKLAVPLTCCVLENIDQAKAYLNPNPLNSTLCQALEPMRHEGLRHKKGCMDSLEQWYKEQYIIFLAAGLVIVLVEFSVLLSTILAFTKICKHKQAEKDSTKQISESNTPKIPQVSENIYQRRSPFPYSNDTYTTTSSFRQNYKLMDKA